MATTTDTDVNTLLAEWHGQIVPRSFNAGFVTLSYIVSLIGAATTLELINRRTAPRGLFNNLLLISAAVTMGGIAIWCMHYIGNRAIEMADGQTQLQIAYSSGFTALSFFVPILVLLTAFVAIGSTNTKVSWWRVAVGGTLAGAAICGMHYLGNASINNYSCVYEAANVVGAALIAVAASIIALSLFFVFRAAWTSSWWKRMISAVVLAGAVSGMHWVASTGTNYRLLSINSASSGELSRNITVIVVICLSVFAALVMAFTAVYTARVMKRTAHKAQQIVLAAAIFDKQGRVLVSPEGLLPSERVTDSFFEKTPQDSFTIAHPLFLWMFQASRNWSSIASIIGGITEHLHNLPQHGRDNSRRAVKLTTEHGETIANYDVIFKELFCAAAAALADRLKSQLTNVGVLWNEILPTGASATVVRQEAGKPTNMDAESAASYEDLAEKGFFRPIHYEIGRGSLMFLVRHVETNREIEQLEAAGFRFAELHQVGGIISSNMQIKTRSIESKMRDMATYARDNAMLEPGVHLGFFSIRARVGSHGFDVLARSNERNMLPSIQMPFAKFEPWQLAFLQQFDRCTPQQLVKSLEGMQLTTQREIVFASQMVDGIKALRIAVDEQVFEEALLCPATVQVPCRDVVDRSSSTSTCTMMAFRAVMPIHLQVSSTKCELVPLSLFKVHQLVYKDSPAHLAFSRDVHREISPLIHSASLTRTSTGQGRRTSIDTAKIPRRLFKRTRPSTSTSQATLHIEDDSHGLPTDRSISPAVSHHESTYKLWPRRSSSIDGDDLGLRGSTSKDSTPGMSPEALSPTTATSMGEEGAQVTAPRPVHAAPSVISQYSSPDLEPYTHPGSYGGIMVSHQVTVDVQDAGASRQPTPPTDDGGRAASRAEKLLLRRRASSVGGNVPVPDPDHMAGSHPSRKQSNAAASGGRDFNSGSITMPAIEMRPIADRSSVHVGMGTQVSNVLAEKPESTNVVTFVDELFAFCVDHR